MIIHWHLSSRVLLVRNKMKRVPIGCDSPVPTPCFISQSQLSLWLCYGLPVLNRRLLLWCMSYNLKFSDAEFYFKPACEQNITDHSYNNYLWVLSPKRESILIFPRQTGRNRRTHQIVRLAWIGWCGLHVSACYSFSPQQNCVCVASSTIKPTC